MDTNELIVRTVWQALRGTIRSYNSSPGMCLAWVRTMVEQAMGWPSHTLYRDYVTEWVQPEGYDQRDGHWARDAERSLRNLGMALGDTGEAQPGDLLFNWRAAWSDRWGAYIGHVGIKIEHGFVAENIDPTYRPSALRNGALAITPIEDWAKPTTVIRFDPTLRR